MLHNRLAELRKKNNLTQEDLALHVQVSRQTIIAIEKGNYSPSLLLGLQIAQFLSVSIEDIFYLSE